MAALVIHRLPEGLVVGGLLISSHGLKVAAGGAAILAVMTLAGAAGGSEVLRQVDGRSLTFAVAGRMGALLRAVVHGHAPARLRVTRGALSALLGAALVIAAPELP